MIKYLNNKMKINYIVNARIPTEKANGYQVSKMCEEFSEKGADVDLLISSRKNNIKENIFDYYKIKNNFKVKIIKSFNFFVFYKFLGVFSYYLQGFWFYVKLFFLKIDKDVIIYTRSSEITFVFKLRKYKVAYECHSWPYSKIFLFKFFLNKVDFIITTTEQLKNKFIDNGFKKEKILVAHDGVDLVNFDIDITKEEARKKLNIPIDIKIVGYTGNFRTMGQDKGLKDIIKAIKILKDGGWDIYFYAVGGSQKDIEFYKKLVKENSVEYRVFLLERVDIDFLAIYQKAFDILLMPFPNTEHYAYYMSPLKMFEYMASKRPIIASNLPSIKEILNDKNCLFCEPNNSNDLSSKIIQLIDNKKLSTELSQKAYENIQEYSWSKRAEKILNFLK